MAAKQGLSDILLHFAVPFSLLYYLRGWKVALVAAVVALLPDLDVLLRVHRSLSHSLVVVGLVSLLMLFLARSRYPTHVGVVAAMVLGLLSHLVLDIFNGAVPIMWPLMQDSILLDFDVLVKMSNVPSITLEASLRTVPTRFEMFEKFDGTLFSGESVIISSSLLLGTVLSAMRKRTAGQR